MGSWIGCFDARTGELLPVFGNINSEHSQEMSLPASFPRPNYDLAPSSRRSLASEKPGLGCHPLLESQPQKPDILGSLCSVERSDFPRIDLRVRFGTACPFLFTLDGLPVPFLPPRFTAGKARTAGLQPLSFSANQASKNVSDICEIMFGMFL
eukprot:g24337.t1